VKLTSLALCLCASAAVAQEAPPVFKTPLAATGYAVGVDMVRNFKSQSVPFDLEQIIRGMRDAAAGGKLLLPDAEVKRLVSQLEAEVRQKMLAARKAEADVNLRTSTEFLKANAGKPGVVTLASGLQYRIEKTGSGAKAGNDATVLVNYRGMLIDGTVFDASPEGKPAAFKVASVIPGWREALKLISAGSKWTLFVPPQLAYGERGAGGVIGPQQALQFEVEVVEVR
jgi:FKBP-type peptidyl-prolyl cis-trans isomerase FklB